jgi:biopolymer transport protein ExbD
MRSLPRFGVGLQTTALIDIVFLLLVFFVMTFRVAAPEGDFDVEMANASDRGSPPVEPFEIPLTLRLEADAAGNLAGIRLNERGFDSLAELHEFVVQHVGPQHAADQELEIRPDYGLAYSHVVDALTAVRGRHTPAGGVEDLITQIRLAP